MKLTKANNNNFRFPSLWKTYSLLLLLVGMSSQSFGQIYVGENATVSVQEGTNFHISENKTEEFQTVKIYVGENAKIINFPKDSLIEIVYFKNEKQPQKSRETIAQNKPKKPLQPTKVEMGTEPESRKSALSFNSIPKTPSALFYSGRATKAALVQNISFRAKFSPTKKSYNNTIHSFLLNDDQQIKTSSNEILLLQQANLEKYITRPPPFQIA